MELDDLKPYLQHKIVTDAEKNLQAVNKEMLYKRSTNIISKINSNLLMELWLAIGALAFFIYYAFYGSVTWAKNYILILLPILLLFYWQIFKFYKQIKVAETMADSNVLSSLTSTKNLLQKFIRNYLVFNMWFAFLCIAIATLLSIQANSNGQAAFITKLSNWQVWLFIIFCWAIFLVLAYLFTKYWIKIFYGKHVHQLEKNIRELQD